VDKRQIIGSIDCFISDRTLTEEEVVKEIRFAMDARVHSVHVWPYHMATNVRTLAGSGIEPGGEISFPDGLQLPEVKVAQTRALAELGCMEFDVCINVSALRDRRDDYVLDELRQIVRAAKGREVKVILQVTYLTDEEKIRGAELAVKAGAQFVKTSGGDMNMSRWNPLHDAALLHQAVGDRIGVKVSDGFRNLEDYHLAEDFLMAGASRLGLGPLELPILVDKL